jgi:tRNA(Ile2) C34 agmatinyltransferase TiaS
MLHVGIDDTDSLDGGCTTWVAWRVIEELQPDFDLIGPPRLVRLNPDVLWKTRGNGAVALAFGRGAGRVFRMPRRSHTSSDPSPSNSSGSSARPVTSRSPFHATLTRLLLRYATASATTGERCG